MTRKRLTAAAARKRILDAATARFREGGVEAVKVQAIAADLGITDAAIHYHFKDRHGLLEALLRRAGRNLQLQIEDIVGMWRTGGGGVPELVRLIREVYEREGFASLALWLWLSGWRSTGSGMLSELAAEIGETEDGGHREEIQFVLALLHMAVFADSIWGGEFLRSVGLRDTRAVNARFDQWLERFFARSLGE